MGRTPLPDASNVLRTAEVGLVLRVGEPTTLAGTLAGLATSRLGAELLMPEIAPLRQKQLVTAEALASEGGPGHDPGRRARDPAAQNRSRRARSRGGRKRRKKEEKLDRRSAGRKRRWKKTRISNRWNHRVFGSAATPDAPAVHTPGRNGSAKLLNFSGFRCLRFVDKRAGVCAQGAEWPGVALFTANAPGHGAGPGAFRVARRPPRKVNRRQPT